MTFQRDSAVAVPWEGLRRVLAASAQGLPWAFVDLDATLIPPGKEISPRSARAVRSYVRAGGRVSLATGRHPHALGALVETLELDTPCLAGNGSVISVEGRLRLLFGIAGLAETAAQQLRAFRIPHIQYTLAGLYIQSPEVTQAQVDLLVAAFHDYQPIRSAPPDPDTMFKILCFVSSEEQERDRQVRQLGEATGLEAVRTSNQFLELVSRDCGKGPAMAVVVEESGWPLERTIAIGDSENDLSMITRAGLGVAVANATPEVLRAADLVVPSCEDDGVAQLMETLVNGRQAE